MYEKLSILGLCAVVLTSSTVLRPDDPSWPQFRGAGARGVDDSRPLPESWDVETGKNIVWRVKVPGLGHSSPVIVGDRVFVTTAVRPSGEQDLRVGLYGDIAPVADEGEIDWRIICFDRKTGETRWSKSALVAVPKVKRHTKATHVNSTPATDGSRIVTFLGSEGLFCYGVDGTFLWKKDLGDLDSGYFRVPAAQWGFGSSPVLHQGKIVVQCDVQRGSFVALLDAKDGREIWKTMREEVPTWGTPTVHVGERSTQIILNGYKHSGSYDFVTGETIWTVKGGGDIPVPTPVVHGDLVFLTSAHGRMRPIYAVRLNAKGDVTPKDEKEPGDYLAWFRKRAGNYMQTPIVYRDLAYFCYDNGILSCYEPKTGQRYYQQRIGKGTRGFTASPVAGDGKLYFADEMGDVHVIKAGNEFVLLKKNELSEVVMASPAIADGVLFFRTQGHLVAVGKKN